MRRIDVREYGILPGDDKETTWKLRKMLEDLRGEEQIEILFGPGTYHFYPDYAVEKLLYISNHDEDTIKKIAFDLGGMKQIKINGAGAEFLFHTDIIPFHIDQCENIQIEGFTVDYARTGYSEGHILEVTEKRMLLEIDRKEYPYRVIHESCILKRRADSVNCTVDVWRWTGKEERRFIRDGISVFKNHTRLPTELSFGKQEKIRLKCF